MIKGNRQGQAGSLVTYQCGEAENKAGYWPEWSKGGGGRWKGSDAPTPNAGVAFWTIREQRRSGRSLRSNASTAETGKAALRPGRGRSGHI